MIFFLRKKTTDDVYEIVTVNNKVIELVLTKICPSLFSFHKIVALTLTSYISGCVYGLQSNTAWLVYFVWIRLHIGHNSHWNVFWLAAGWLAGCWLAGCWLAGRLLTGWLLTGCWLLAVGWLPLHGLHSAGFPVPMLHISQWFNPPHNPHQVIPQSAGSVGLAGSDNPSRG